MAKSSPTRTTWTPTEPERHNPERHCPRTHDTHETALTGIHLVGAEFVFRGHGGSVGPVA